MAKNNTMAKKYFKWRTVKSYQSTTNFTPDIDKKVEIDTLSESLLDPQMTTLYWKYQATWRRRCHRITCTRTIEKVISTMWKTQSEAKRVATVKAAGNASLREGTARTDDTNDNDNEDELFIAERCKQCREERELLHVYTALCFKVPRRPGGKLSCANKLLIRPYPVAI